MQKNLPKNMKLETRKVTLLLCTALAIALGSCTKKTITPAPEPDPQPAEVGFTAASQAVWVKGTDDEFKYDKFAVWGIARDSSIPATYNLWNDNFTAVNRKKTASNEPTDDFIPEGDEYWLRGYTYDFLAFAPYDALALNDVAIIHKDDTGNTKGKDYMSFIYDLSEAYEDSEYEYDFLVAAAQTINNQGGRTDGQPLIFWHALSQIEITNISFTSGIKGSVDKITLYAYPSGHFEVAFDNSEANLTKPTSLSCDAITTTADKYDFTFNNPDFSKSHPIVNIIPQRVEHLELYLDFTITDGDSVIDKYENFKINLNAQDLEEYVCNGKYNWSITIGTKNAISFDVKVGGWTDATVPGEYPLN